MKKLLLFLSGVIFSASAQAAPVWSTNVAPILYNKCTSCHHAGGIAPFALMTYDQAVLNSMAIKNDVQNRTMPPWPPSPSYSHFAHERVLSSAEIATIVDWVNAGTPSGVLSMAPPPPVYGSGGTLPGTPDLVLRIPTYTSTAGTDDLYQCFSIPSGLLSNKYITAFEAIPGNPAIVHHVLVYADTTGTCAHLDSLSAGPGYPSFGGVGSSSASLIGAWVPGTAPMIYPTGFGVRVPAAADVVMQIHYPAGTTGLADSTEVHFFFSPLSTVRNVFITPVLNHETNIDNPLFIPANTTRSFSEQLISPFDISLIGLAPHMHLLGQKIKTYGVPFASTDTIKLIDIPKWDFHWQGFYTFPKIRKIPSGTKLRAEALFDNTTSNPENPSSPPEDVSAGEATTDEMMLVYFVFAEYQPGDENTIIDTGVAMGTRPEFTNYYHGQQLLDVCPNPVVNSVVIKCYLDNADMAVIDLVDMQGKTVHRFMNNELINKGYNAFTYPITGIAAGTYTLRMQTRERILTQKVVVVN